MNLFTPGVALKVLVYFARNDSEYMTTRDIAVKFGSTSHRVPLSLRRLRKDGLLCADLLDGHLSGGYVWSAGPELKKLIGVKQ